MNSVLDAAQKSCTGCGACVAVCSQKALKYVLNEHGFWTPQLNESLCISCGLCKKVCYKFIEETDCGSQLLQGEMYAMQSKSVQTVHSCTSGGIAYELAKQAIERGYIVTGTIYDSTKHIAKTVIVSTLKELEATKGSKYIQSSAAETLVECLKKAQENAKEKFMFFGTPCQIVGVKKAFDILNLHNKVLTVDLFCHGVPSYLLWHQYLKEKGIEKDKTNYTVQFRSSSVPWHRYALEINTQNQKTITPSGRDEFYAFFFDNKALNPACLDCIMRKERSVADIRLGDYWGTRYKNRTDGVSACVALTHQGDELLTQCEMLQIIDKTTVDDCLSTQSTHNYHGESTVIQLLKEKHSLQEIIAYYRKTATFKQKIKYALKWVLSYIQSIIYVKKSQSGEINKNHKEN